MKYDRSLFASTATYYAKYRPSYPEELLDKIIETFGLSKDDIVLDLGCGTGEIALPLSKYVKRVIAWDPDIEMLDMAKQKAKAQNITNIDFDLKSSDNLSEIKDKIKLVTMGRSFHWMDGVSTLSDIKNILVDGGGVAILDSKQGLGFAYSTLVDEPDETTTERDKIVGEIVLKHLGRERLAGKSAYKQVEQSFEEMEQEAGYRDISETLFDMTLTRNIDETIGFLYSTSWGNKAQLGDKADGFERELKEKLLALKPDGVFSERIIFSLLTAKISVSD